MKLFELFIGQTRRYVAAIDAADAYNIGTDPKQHPDISYLPFSITEITVPGYIVNVVPECGGDGDNDDPDAIPTEREALKAWLTARGVEYGGRTGDAKLREIAESWKPPEAE